MATDLFVKKKCGYCQDEILGVHIRCTVCVDYDLCFQCFSLGCEIGPHKPNHSYKFIPLNEFYQRGNNSATWIAREDYQLLDAIEQFGYGNWEDVAKHVETRDSESSKVHYCERFVTGTIGKSTWLALPNGLLASGESRLMAIDHTLPNANAPLSPSITSRLPPLAIQPEETLELGYMPQRDDFEREHDNEAEAIVSHLAINHDDEDLDLALKLAQVDMYTRRLRERARRKRVARDFQLVSQYFSTIAKEKEKPTTAAKKKEQLKEKEMQENLRAFSQFHTASEHEQFLRNMTKERALRLRIRELIKYRRNGLTRQEECTEYERLRYCREKRKEARVERQRRKSSSSQLMILFRLVLLFGPNSSAREAQVLSNREGNVSFSGLNASSSRPRPVLPSVKTLLNRADWREAVSEQIANSDDITLCPGSELLTPVERQICQSYRLRPLYYMTCKTNLLLSGTQKTPFLPGLAMEEQNAISNYCTQAGFLSMD
uniref:Transcriptional adapter n=1 Tax=Alona affinis TaxID=381656 RepID=A0A9N6WNV9_9CRUS|nr:EOG090X058A [Alona affinis]